MLELPNIDLSVFSDSIKTILSIFAILLKAFGKLATQAIDYLVDLINVMADKF
jgi:hypothetical protein